MSSPFMVSIAKSCQNISSSVGFTKTRAFPTKSGQNNSSSLEFTKTRAFAAKSGQNISRRNNISQASPEKNARSYGIKQGFLSCFLRKGHIQLFYQKHV